MESLPMPRTTTILPPPPMVSEDPWAPLCRFRFAERDDFGGLDAGSWGSDGYPTDVDELRTLPISA
jgi:hypothetical protein